MSEEDELRSGADADQRRDALLLKLLKTPPQPRPKREHGEDGAKDKPKSSRKT